MREYNRTHHYCVLSPIANIRSSKAPAPNRRSREGRVAFALFLELQHGRTGSDLDFAIDDGALGDRNGACADPAANDCGIADFELVPDVQSSGDLAGDDGLLRLDEAVPGSRGGEIEAALQFTVAVHFAGNHEMSGAADVADEHGFGADESRSSRVAFQESPFLCAHGHLLTHLGQSVMTSLASPRHRESK